ncbi:MAG: gamma-aminobutyrate permease, partial [Lactobacillaceae bacterium]|nr:gamma-aminobutyrate permease [Lactobacillaceae bacterium]
MDEELLAVEANNPKLKRSLNSRLISMLSLGGAIGTGLFLSSGQTIATAGPMGALVAYVLIG